MRPRITASVLRLMRLGERLVLGLMVGILATDLATLASTVPYIYTQDHELSCWALGLSRFSLRAAPRILMVLVAATIFFIIGRACVSAIRRRRVPLFLVGIIVWGATALAGLGYITNVFMLVAMLLQSPPPLPPHSPSVDVKACGDLIPIPPLPSVFIQFFRGFLVGPRG